MTFGDIVTAITNGGLSIVLIAYLIYSDYQYNKTMLQTMTKMESTINIVKELVEKFIDSKDI